MKSRQAWHPHSVPVIDLAVRIRNYDGTLIVAAGLNEQMELADVAAFIWRQIDGHRTVATIADTVAHEYAIDATMARDDVFELLTDLAAADLIEPPGSPTS